LQGHNRWGFAMMKGTMIVAVAAATLLGAGAALAKPPSGGAGGTGRPGPGLAKPSK